MVERVREQGAAIDNHEKIVEQLLSALPKKDLFVFNSLSTASLDFARQT